MADEAGTGIPFNTNQAENIAALFGDAKLISGVSNGSSDTESVHAHGLGRVPRGFLIISKDKAGDFYDSAGHDVTELKIKNTVTSVTFVAIVF